MSDAPNTPCGSCAHVHVTGKSGDDVICRCGKGEWENRLMSNLNHGKRCCEWYERLEEEE